MQLAGSLRQRFFDSNGNPLAGGYLYTYQAGTEIPQITYNDQGGNSENENPIELDADGYCDLWLDPELAYSFALHDADDVPIMDMIGPYFGNAAADSIDSDAIQDNAVGTEHLQDDCVTADELADSDSDDEDRAVTTNHIRDGAVTDEKLDARALDDVLVSTTTTPYSLGTDTDTVLMNATAGAKTINLHSAVVSGIRHYIKKTDSSFNAVTVTPDGVETIDGAASTTLNTQGEAIEIISDGTNWHILARHIPSVWTATPAPSGTPSNSTRNFYFWRRMKDSVEVQMGLTATGAASTDWLTMVVANWIPSGLSIDSSKLAVYLAAAETDRCNVGTYSAQDTGTALFNGTVSMDTTGSLTNSVYNSASFPFTVANTDGLTIRISVPISGWKG